jgi:hypothetical protein
MKLLLLIIVRLSATLGMNVISMADGIIVAMNEYIEV